MLEKIKHIIPKAISSIPKLQSLLTMLMNIVENLSQRVDEVEAENQALRDEINRLKGEHGDLPPKKTKNGAADSSDEPNEPKDEPRRKNNKTGPKNPNIPIDNTVICPIDKSELPADAKFQGYHKVIQQDIIIKRNNTLFKVPYYYSKSEGQTYRGTLPAEYIGQFGGQLKSWLQLLHHYCDTTQGRLKALMSNLGIYISTGTISNIALSNESMMRAEAAAILKAGIATIPYAQMDGTKSKEAGQGKSTQIISTPYYSLYYTMDTKSKANVIWALQGKPGDSVPLTYNATAVDWLNATKVPIKDQKILQQLLVPDQVYTLIDLEELFTQHAPHLLDKEASYPKMLAALALGHYRSQTDFPQVNILLSDAGPEYVGIATHQSLCWLHEARHYKKMVPKLQLHQNKLAGVIDQIWGFYKKLLAFKELPSQEQALQKQVLWDEFDTICTQKTDYEALDNRLEKTYAKKEKLLVVLDYPYLPLHNNNAELAVRRKVRKRDISLHTISAKGTKAQDAFMSVVETAAKLGVNALDYIYDRVTHKLQMTSLEQLIRTNTPMF